MRLGKLVGEQGAGEPTPGETRIDTEGLERAGDLPEACGLVAELGERRSKLAPALRPVEILGKGADRPFLQGQRTPWIASGGPQEERPPARCSQLVGRQAHALRREECERGEGLVYRCGWQLPFELRPRRRRSGLTRLLRACGLRTGPA